MTWVSFAVKSGNKKTGPIGVSTSDADSCAPNCMHKDTTCYARFGPLAIHWRRIGKTTGDNWTKFCDRIRILPRGFLWRHNQAGDLPPTKRGRISIRKLRQLIRAARHTRVWTYTHYSPLDETNARAIEEANNNGFVVNMSADSPAQADEYRTLSIGPVVCTLPSDSPIRGLKTPAGVPIVVCPAQIDEQIDCKSCLLCLKRDRKSIVGFLAHGTAKNKLDLILN